MLKKYDFAKKRQKILIIIQRETTFAILLGSKKYKSFRF